MKVLIMSVTAGEGHNSTARAMKSYFDAHGTECSILDTYRYVSPAVAKLISEGYLLVSDKLKVAFGAGYRMAEKRRGGTGEKSAARLVNTLFSDDIYDYIDGYAPDAVIFTHPFAGMIMDIMCQRHTVRAKLIGVLTDFVFHPYWEECLMCDYVITPSPMLNYQAKQKGFDEKSVLALGIPINEKFSRSQPKREMRVKHGLDPAMKTILIMGGSMGYGHMAKTVRDVDRLDIGEDFQIICVCGNNEDMRNKINAYAPSAVRRILNLGFVGYVDELMDASDLIVSKPGGLTTSEALAKRLPMIIVNPIPGQESRNTAFLLNNGAAVAASSTCPVPELVYSLFKNPERIDAMLRNIDILRRPNSAADVCEFTMKLCGGAERV